ncbi:MAG: HAD family hydrolase [Fimbriimonas sp.]
MSSLPKVIVFDLDDTLCGYWDASKAGLRRAFELHELDPEAMSRHWAKAFRAFAPTLKKTDWYPIYLERGEPTRTEQMRLTLVEAGIEDAALARSLGDAYGRERDAALTLFGDAIEVLDALHPRFRLGLLTNGPADIQRQEIATTGIGHYFEHLMIEGELGEGKPNLSVFREVERRFGVGPESMAMVGNSYHHDILGAVGAGWQTVWIRRPSDVPPSVDGSSKPEERGADEPAPDHEITELRALLDIWA